MVTSTRIIGPASLGRPSGSVDAAQSNLPRWRHRRRLILHLGYWVVSWGVVRLLPPDLLDRFQHPAPYVRAVQVFEGFADDALQGFVHGGI